MKTRQPMFKAVRMFDGHLMFTIMRNPVVAQTVMKDFGGGFDKASRKFGFWLRVNDTLYMLYQPIKA